jgi:hypothetical protein
VPQDGAFEHCIARGVRRAGLAAAACIRAPDKRANSDSCPPPPVLIGCDARVVIERLGRGFELRWQRPRPSGSEWHVKQEQQARGGAMRVRAGDGGGGSSVVGE